WRVTTPRGDIDAGQVVSCTGNFANNTMGLVGRSSPSVPVRHQYIITESLPILESRRAQGLPEVPVCRDPEQSFYVRQEGTSLLMGCYEAVGEPAYVYDCPDPGGATLFEDQLDKLLPYLELAMERFPVLGESGIAHVINSAMPYSPDDLPVLGPLPGKQNFWLAEGSPFGITLAGGIGWQMAEWIVEGEPSIDLMSCDSRRFDDFATRSYSTITTKEAYEHTYRLPKPDQQPE
ncbi:MAG: FAD-dependent oxidoreductase, partial [bacterium]|nr:FAD-dependent oxidoreductase [bacterium]